jgi:hypothetical protein
MGAQPPQQQFQQQSGGSKGGFKNRMKMPAQPLPPGMLQQPGGFLTAAPGQPPPPGTSAVVGGLGGASGVWEWEELAWAPVEPHTTARLSAAHAQRQVRVLCRGPNGEAWVVDLAAMRLAAVDLATGAAAGAVRQMRAAPTGGLELKQPTGVWRPFAPSDSHALQQASHGGAPSTVALAAGAHAFHVDVQKRVQTNARTGSARNVRFVPHANAHAAHAYAAYQPLAAPGGQPRNNQPPPGPAFPGGAAPRPNQPTPGPAFPGGAAPRPNQPTSGPAFPGGAAPPSTAAAAAPAAAPAPLLSAPAQAAAGLCSDEEPPPRWGQTAWPPPCFLTGCSAARCAPHEATAFPCGHRGLCAAHSRSEAACALCGEPRSVVARK